MNQQKTGEFLKVLRKEKGLTQEQLGEKFYVSSRTVSRWETGSNLPDLQTLIELAEFYEIDIREIINGERKSENMDKEMKETLVKVSEYSDSEKKTKAKKINILFALGLVLILAGVFNSQFEFIYKIIGNNHIGQALSGMTFGLGIGFEAVAFYFNNHDVSFKNKKTALIKK